MFSIYRGLNVVIKFENNNQVYKIELYMSLLILMDACI